MTTTAQTQTTDRPKADLTFNVFYNEDTTTKGFLQTLVLKNPWEWTMLRQAFERKRNASITIVDRSIETPFHCLLAALFCKQLVEELGLLSPKVRLILTPLKKEQPGKLVTVNESFGMTFERNDFLRECFLRVMGTSVALATKRNPVHCRDLKIVTDDYTLFIRCEGGITRGWQPSNKYLAEMPSSELFEVHSSDLPCHSQYVHGHNRTGHFISIELLPNNKFLDK